MTLTQETLRKSIYMKQKNNATCEYHTAEFVSLHERLKTSYSKPL